MHQPPTPPLFDQFTHELAIAGYKKRYRQSLAAFATRAQSCLQFIEHQTSNDRKVGHSRRGDGQPRQFDKFGIGVSDISQPVDDGVIFNAKEAGIKTPRESGWSYRPRNESQP